jgi:hypothetical protein
VLRSLLLVYAVLVACPIRFWPLIPTGDNTWVFALNQAAASGQGTVWTMGPLGYLTFPQDIGHNLAWGLAFQTALWGALIAVFADLYLRSGIAMRNLAVFSALLGMAAPMFWFNYTGVENLLIAAVLLLLILERRHGGGVRYVAALVLSGVAPMIKLNSAAVAAGAVAGFLVDRGLRKGWSKVWRPAAAAVAIPLAAAGACCWFILRSWSGVAALVRSSVDLISGYSTAMSYPPAPYDWDQYLARIVAGAMVVIVAGMIALVARKDPRTGLFLALLAALPLAASFKHGFVRQDNHILNFFCFAMLVLGLVALESHFEGVHRWIMAGVLLASLLIWAAYSVPPDVPENLTASAGVRPLMRIWHVVRGDVRQHLAKATAREFDPEDHVEPELRTIIGHQPVASLSLIYNSAPLDGLDLRLYPVVQRYGAFTPYLDELNAAWIREHGPRFLLFDGSAIDDRQPWAETPAMWAEIYRWYDKRRLAEDDLLLERRARPRFLKLVPAGRFEASLTGTVTIPAARFWSLRCGLNTAGRIAKLIYRVPEVMMTVRGTAYHIIPEVLTSPVIGGGLPATLEEFAAVFDPVAVRKAEPESFTFGGPGRKDYLPGCEVELWRMEQ